MSEAAARDGAILRPWGDGDRAFRLGIGEWRKVQEKCDAGPPELLARLGAIQAAKRAFPDQKVFDLALAGGLGAWRVDDVREVLLQGLIGGGMSPTEAAGLVRELIDERPLFENVSLAFEVVLASVMGPDDEPLGKSRGRAARARRTSPGES